MKPEEALQRHRTACQCFRHYDGCNLCDPDNCSGCALTHGGEEGPTFAGWARVYVESRRPIPARWREAFAKELASENEADRDALNESIDHFGVRIIGGKE